MTQQNTNDTVNEIVEQGRELVNKANQRHVIIRRADGTQLADVSVTMVAVAALVLFFFQPFGTFILFGGIAYGIISKLKIEVVHELASGDDVVEMNIPTDEE